MRYVNIILRIALAGIFLYASYDKLLRPAEFAEAVRAYRLLPDLLVNPVAVGLPWLEFILGLLLISGRWQLGAIFWANLLLMSFLAGILVNMARGLDVHCGCFTSTAAGDPDMQWYVLRDSLFLLLGVATAWSYNRIHKSRRWLVPMTLDTPFRLLNR